MPFQGMLGIDNSWRGSSSFADTGNIYGYSTTTVAEGPLFKTFRISYDFGSSKRYDISFTFYNDGEYAIITEEMSGGPSGSLRMSFYTNFTPDKYIHQNNDMNNPLDIDYSTSGEIQGLNCYSFEYGWFGFYNSGTPKDIVGVFVVDPAKWQGPNQAGQQYGIPNFQIGLNRASSSLYVKYPLATGKRQSGLALVNKDTNVAVTSDISNSTSSNELIQRIYIKNSETPLNMVKDWVLDWEDTATHPAVFYTASDMPAIKSKIETDPYFHELYKEGADKDNNILFVGNKKTGMDDDIRSLLYHMTGDTVYLNKLKQSLLTTYTNTYSLSGHINSFFYNTTLGTFLPAEMRDDMPFIMAYDTLVNSPVLTAGEKKLLKARMAFYAYKLADEDFQPQTNGMYSGHPNFFADHVGLLNATALVLTGHPERDTWLNFFKTQFERHMDKHVSDSGKWVESPASYAGTSMGAYSWQLYFRNKLGIDNLATNSEYKNYLKYFINLTTPPQPNYSWDGKNSSNTPYNQLWTGRAMPGYGAGSAHTVPISSLGASAKLLETNDPTLSGETYWIFNQTAKTTSSHHYNREYELPVANWIPNGFPLIAYSSADFSKGKYANMPSTYFAEMGTIMRLNVGGEDETYAAFAKPSGNLYRWGDENNDLEYFAHGVPIVVTMEKPNNDVNIEDGGEGKYPSRGGTTALTVLNNVNYMLQESPSGSGFDTARKHALLTNDYLVMLDEVDLTDTTKQSRLDMHFLTRSSVTNPSTQVWHIDGNHDVDSDYHIVYPTLSTAVTITDQAMHGQENAKRIRALSNNSTDDWLTIINPHKSGESQLTVAAYGGVTQGSYSLTKGGKTDYLFLNPSDITIDTDDISFTGKAGIINTDNGKLKLTLLNGTKISVGSIGTKGIECSTPGPKVSTVYHSDKDVRGEADMPSNTYMSIRIGVNPLPSTFKVYIDGRSTETPWTAVTNGVRFQIPAGKHTFQIVDCGFTSAPVSPSGLSVAAISPDEIRLEWTDNTTDETEYVVERKTNAGDYSVIERLGSNITYYRDFGVVPGTVYTYRISAKNNYGASSGAEAGVKAMERLPKAPAGVTARSSTSGIVLKWTDNNNNEKFYAVERREQGTSQWIKVGNVSNSNSYTDASAVSQKTYDYRIYAHGQFGDSLYSDIVTVEHGVVNLALNKPVVASSSLRSGNVETKAVDGSLSSSWISKQTDVEWIYVDLGEVKDIGQVVLRWSPTHRAKEYKIQVSNDAAAWTDVYYTNNGSGGVDVINVNKPGRYVKMNGTKRLTSSGYYTINEFEVYAPQGDTIAPRWPEGSKLTAVANGSNGVTVTWTPAQDDMGVTGYKLYQGTNPIAALDKDILSYSIGNLTVGIGYTFKVEAGDEASNWSTDGPSITVILADKTALNTAIFDAQAKHDGAVEGTVPGQYAIGSKNKLQDAINIATGIANSTTVTQAQVDNAIEALNKAVLDFEAAKILDKAKPTWADQSKINIITVAKTSISLGWSNAIDNVGVKEYKVEVFNADNLIKSLQRSINTCLVENLAEGMEYAIKVYAADAAGNISEPLQANVWTDVTAPVTTDNAGGEWSKTSRTITLTAIDEASGVKKTLHSIDGGEYMEGTTARIDAEGVHTVTYYSLDNAGNIEEKKTAIIRIDKTEPVIEEPAKLKVSQTEAVSIEIKAADALSGLKSVVVKLDGNVVSSPITAESLMLALGSHSIEVIARDHAGNTASRSFILEVGIAVSELDELLDLGYQKGFITNEGILNSLQSKVKSIQKDGGDTKKVLNGLKALRNEVEAQAGKKISSDFSALLLIDIECIESLYSIGTEIKK